MKRALLLIALLIALLPATALAHKITAFTDIEGNKVEISAYFNDGTPVKKGEVKVYDSSGKLVFEGKTNKEGVVDLNLKPGKYKAVVIAELGHRAEATFTVGKEEEAKGSGSSPESFITSKTSESNQCQVSQEELRKVIREELQPVKETLLKIEEENSGASLKDIIGGIGWILGIFGGALLLSNRRRGG